MSVIQEIEVMKCCVVSMAAHLGVLEQRFHDEKSQQQSLQEEVLELKQQVLNAVHWPTP
jgi:hypothetical protein